MHKAHCVVSVLSMRTSPNESSEMISQILYGESCTVLGEEGRYVQILTDFDQVEGWVLKLGVEEVQSTVQKNVLKEPYRLFPLERGNTLLSIGSELEDSVYKSEGNTNLLPSLRERIEQTARTFENVPFLHGGRSFFGLDSSAFVQLVYKVHDMALPREAHKQVEMGEFINFIEEAEVGYLAFFEDGEGVINHVGLMLENSEILHCYGKVRKDILDSTGIFNKDLKKHTHKLRFIKRIIS